MFDRADARPVDRHRLLKKCFMADEANFSGSDAVLMDEPSGFHIVAAVFGYLLLFPLPPPLDGLHPRGGLFYATGG